MRTIPQINIVSQRAEEINRARWRRQPAAISVDRLLGLAPEWVSSLNGTLVKAPQRSRRPISHKTFSLRVLGFVMLLTGFRHRLREMMYPPPADPPFSTPYPDALARATSPFAVLQGLGFLLVRRKLFQLLRRRTGGGFPSFHVVHRHSLHLRSAETVLFGRRGRCR